MDWSTLGASVGAALVSGGLIGGLVSVWIGGRESRDRLSLLDFQRQQWQETAEREHEQWLRQQQYEAFNAFIASAGELVAHLTGTTDDERFVQVTTVNTAINSCQVIAPPHVGLLVAEFALTLVPALDRSLTGKNKSEANAAIIGAYTKCAEAMRRHLQRAAV